MDNENILKTGYLLLFSVNEESFVPFKVTHQSAFHLSYNIPTDYSTPVIPPLTTIPASSLPLATIQNETDIFKFTDSVTIYQVLMGIAPSYLNVYLYNSTDAPKSVLSSNLNQNTFKNLGAINGFNHPYDNPDYEFFVFANAPPHFAFYDPVPIPVVNGKLNFLINKMTVAPVTDSKLIKKMYYGSVPVRKESVQGLTFSSIASYYGGAMPILNDSMKYNDEDFMKYLKEKVYFNIKEEVF